MCVAPDELPAFGRFGCAPDCGNAKVLTRVRLEMECDFSSGEGEGGGGPTDLTKTLWNLCSPSHLVDDAPICWYETDQQFTLMSQTVVDTLDLPDGVWELTVDAPNGGVTRGEVVQLGKASELDDDSQGVNTQAPTRLLLMSQSQGGQSPATGFFTVNDSGQSVYIPELSDADTRERFLGVSNRVVAGVLVHTTRASTERCASSRFAQLGPECASESGLDLSPYGIDPVFLHTSADLFDESLAQEYAKYHGVKLYGQRSNFTANCTPPSCGTHYSAEEVNERGAPYGFFHEKLEGHDDGFAVFFDVNANEAQASNLLKYVKDGFFIDDDTRTMAVSTVTYNAGLGVFSYFHCDFEFSPGGSIVVSSQVQTLSVENYKGDHLDNFRVACEVLFLGITLYHVVLECHEMWACFQTTRSVSGYFQSAWNYIDVLSIALQIVCISLWVHLNFDLADSFSVKSRYKVYADLKAEARFLRLSDDGAGLRAVASKFAEVAAMSDVLITYNTLFGLNLVLLLSIFFKNVDFQPRLGVVTRTLFIALTDLSHFFVVLSVVFVAYSAIGYILFGGQIEMFSTMQSTMETLFNWMAIGDQGAAGDVFLLSVGLRKLKSVTSDP